MEDTDGGLHPALDGQSLDEDEDEDDVHFSCPYVRLISFAFPVLVGDQTIVHNYFGFFAGFSFHVP